MDKTQKGQRQYAENVDMFDNFQEKKQRVKDMIREGMNRRETLTTVKENIGKSGFCKSRAEAFYIKQYYVKNCSNEFLTEIEDLFKNGKDPSTLQNIHDFDGIHCEPFEHAKSYKLFKECERDMRETQKHAFVNKLLRNCWAIVLDNRKMFMWEMSFIDETLKCIKKGFESNESYFAKLDSPSNFNSKDVLEQLLNRLAIPTLVEERSQQITDAHAHTISNVLGQLLNRHAIPTLVEERSQSNTGAHAHTIGNGSTLSKHFLNNFHQVLDEVNGRAELTVDDTENKICVLYRKSYVYWDEAVKEMQDLGVALDDASEIRIFANELLIVNESFCWHGVNVVIASKKIIIKEGNSYVWNVSGKSAAKQERERAPDGKQHGDDGVAGERGCHGQSGGNILVITDQMINAEALMIISNGGDGSHGQHGGNGKDGKDGKDGVGLDLETFKSKFPDPAVVVGEKAGWNHFKCLTNAPHKIKSHRCWRSEYVERKTSDQNLVQMAWHGAWFRQSYCIHYGTNGTKGTKGGDGGCGGEAGLGGYPGDIQFIAFSAEGECGLEKQEQFQGRDGINGSNGKAGKGGKTGKKGMDNGRVTEHIVTQTHWFHGHLELRLSDTWYYQDCYAWCPRHKKYASIHKLSPPSYLTVAERGADGIKNTKNTSGKKQAQRRRQTAILVREIVQQFRNGVRLHSAKEQAHSLQYTVKTLKEMASDSMASISRSVRQIHRQILVEPQDGERSNSRQLSIPTFNIVPDAECETTKQATIYLAKMQFISLCTSDDSDVKDIIENFNEDMNSFDNWYCQLRKLLSLFETAPKQMILKSFSFMTMQRASRNYSGSFMTKQRTSRNYSRIFQLLQRFVMYLQDIDIDMNHAVANYECVAKIRHEIQNIDHELRVQTDSVLELILDVVQGKQKFALIQNIYQCFIMSNNYLLEHLTDKRILELDSPVRDKLMRQCIQRKMIHIVRKLQEASGMTQLMNSFKMTLKSISESDLLQPEDIGPDDSEYFQLLSWNPNTNSHVDESDDNGEEVRGKNIDIDNDFERQGYLLPQSDEVLKNLKFLQIKGIPLLRSVLCSRFVCEGQQISPDTLKWLISIIIGIQDRYAVLEVTTMLALHKQNTWLLEYVIIQMRIIMNLSTEEENKARELLIKIKRERWLLLLSQKLERFSDENSLSFGVIEEIIECMQIGEPDKCTVCLLMKLPLSDWPAQLQWRREFSVLQSLPVKFTSDEQMIQTAEYLWGLRNIYGDDFIKELKQEVSKHTHVEADTFTLLLRNLYNNKWPCDGSSLTIIATTPSNKWEVQLDKRRDVPTSDRSLDTLFKFLNNDPHSSFSENSLAKVKQIVLETYQKEDSPSTPSNLAGRKIGAFECNNITEWCQSLRISGRDAVKDNIPEVLAVIKRGIYLITNCELRHTQMIAFVLFLFNDHNGMLEQVFTGEGKSYIIVALALFKILNGSKTDIITSSSVLAKRDADENRPIYELFGATVSHNCYEDEEERKKAYKAAVVYGEIGGFQRDILLDEFYNENIMGDRRSENVIVDEVDSMLLDKGQNVLYLSHDVSGLESLEQVYVHIWSFVHSKGLCGTTEDEEVVYCAMLDALFGTFTTDDIEKAWVAVCTLTPSELDHLWKVMKVENLIDGTGVVIVNGDVINRLKNIHFPGRLSSEEWDLLSCVKNVLKESISASGKIGKDDIQNKWLAMNSFTKEQLPKLYQQLKHQGLVDNDGIIVDKNIIMSNKTLIQLPLTIFEMEGELKDCEFQEKDKLSQTEITEKLLDHKRSADIQACITSALKDSIRRGSTLCVPHYLESFIRRHLRTWIRNAFKARFLSESEHYIVDVDRSSYYQNSCNIIIIDTDTGTEQYNTQWNHGLHQFLQLKHGCRMSSESLKAVFMSNISFFKRYEPNIYGLTGTLGSDGERRLLKNLYHIEYMTVPTFRPSSFFEEEGIVCQNQEMWLDQITKCVLGVYRSRPVLVICETIKDLETIERDLQKTVEAKLHIYKHSYEAPDILKEAAVGKSCIILATNLAGRGTDIKISEATSKSGGLFVCLTYLPSNIRVEQQAFGRTARKGQEGSGQMIILERGEDECTSPTKSVDRFVSLKTRRDVVEKNRINRIQNEYESKLRVEEDLFMKFEKRFTSFREVLKHVKKKEVDKIEVSLLLQVLLDKWALWLDSYADTIGKRDAWYYVNNAFDIFLDIIDNATIELEAGKPQYQLIDSFANRNKLGKVFIGLKQFDKAQNMFDEVIRTEPKFSEVAHYYKAYCIVKLKDVMKDSPSRTSFDDHLHHAKLLMQTRIDELQNATVIVQTLSQSYTHAQNSFLAIDEYKKQNDGVINLYTIFTRSIDDICGHEISPVIIQDITEDPLQAQIIFEDLLRNGILTNHRVASNYEEKLQELENEYALYMDKLKTTLAELSQISSNDLAHVLPNREDFWNSLQNVNILTKEEEFVLIDKNRMKEVRFPNKKNFLETLDEYVRTYQIQGVDKDESNSTVWLYPQLPKQDEEQVLIPRSQFEASFGRVESWGAFKRANIIRLTKRAEINQNINPEQVQLPFFDEMDDKAFTIIKGVDKDASKKIFNQLIGQNILSRSTPARLLRRDIQDINLKCYQPYRTEVINVIVMRYQYHIALQDFITNRSQTFATRPHTGLFQTLIDYKIVTPIKVTSSTKDEIIKKTLEKLYGKGQTHAERCIDDEGDYKSDFLDGCPLVTDKEVNDVCNLHSVSPKLIADFMSEKKIWVQQCGQYRITCTEDDVKRINLTHDLNSIEYPMKNTILAKLHANKHIDSVNKMLISLQSGLYKHNSIDSNLKHFEQYIDEDTKLSMFKELVRFSLSGLDHVITLFEEKWTRQCCMKIAGIIAIGILQCIAGIAVEVFTSGWGTHIARGLIAEGFGDIIFAMACMFNGYCSLEVYAKQKANSLIITTITVVTQGIGAWFLRGAKFSDFGYKIGGKALGELSGKKLIQEVGKKEITEQVAKRLGTMLVETTAIGLANAGIDYAIEYAIREQLQNMCESSLADLVTSFDSKIEQHDLRRISLKLQNQVGTPKALQTISTISMKTIESITKSDYVSYEIDSLVSYVCKGVSGGFASAETSLKRSRDARAATISRVVQVMKITLTTLSIVKSMTGLMSLLRDSVFQQIANELEKKIKQNEKIQMNYEEKGDKESFVNEAMANLKRVIRETVREMVELDFVKPAMRYCANKAIQYAGKAIEAVYHKVRNFKHHLEFKQLLQKYMSFKKRQGKADDSAENDILGNTSILTEYNDKLLKLLSKTRDPDLFANIVRAGVPTSIHCTQAVAEILGRTIHIRVIGGDYAIPFPDKFEPEGTLTSGEPLFLDFYPGENGGIGHFETSGDSGATSGVKYDCLLDALKEQGVTINREDIAKRIETNVNLRKLVESGIHKHFIWKGGVGGARRTTKTRRRNMERRRRGLLKMTVHKHQLIDRGLQNHEIMMRSITVTVNWRKELKFIPKSTFGKEKIIYDHTHVSIYIRLDYRYIVFPHDKNTIGGHTGVFLNKEGRSGVYTNGQVKYHKALTKEFFQISLSENNTEVYTLRRDRTAQTATTHALLTHVELTDISHITSVPDDIPITLTGHDLSNPQHLEQYRLGVNRSRFMSFLGAKCLSGNTTDVDTQERMNTLELGFFGSGGSLAGDPFPDIIRPRFQSAQSISELGDLLMSAPSWHSEINDENALDPNPIPPRRRRYP